MRSGVAGCDDRKSGARRIDGAALLRLEIRIVLHRGEEAHRAVGIVAGARGDADADARRPRIPASARSSPARVFDLASASAPTSGSVSHVGDDAADEIGVARLFLAVLGVPRDDVAHLVGQHRGEFEFVVGERDQAAGDVELAGRQRKGVDRLRIEHGDLVVQVGPLRCRDQALDGLLDHGLQAGIVIDPAIGGEDALMFARHRGRRLGRRRLDRRHRGGLGCDRRRRGGARRQQQRNDSCAGMPKTCDPRTSPLHRHVTRIHLTSAVSICSG